ncbi:DUF3902 family protein, partial [Bacillus thuringiensis]
TSVQFSDGCLTFGNKPSYVFLTLSTLRVFRAPLQLILLNLLLTLGPVLWPLLLSIIGNGMNASAGW